MMCIAMCISYPSSICITVEADSPVFTFPVGALVEYVSGSTKPFSLGAVTYWAQCCVCTTPSSHLSACLYRTRSQGEHDAAAPRGNIRTIATCNPSQITQSPPSQSHRSVWAPPLQSHRSARKPTSFLRSSPTLQSHRSARKPTSLMRSSSILQSQEASWNFRLLTSRGS